VKRKLNRREKERNIPTKKVPGGVMVFKRVPLDAKCWMELRIKLVCIYLFNGKSQISCFYFKKVKK
jgi:hypothetical protein